MTHIGELKGTPEEVKFQKSIAAFQNFMQGEPRAPILDDVGIADRSFDENMRAFRAGFLDTPIPKGLGIMFDRRGPFQGTWDADMHHQLAQYRAGGTEPPDPDYDPRSDLRFARLPEHMWPLADEAKSFGEGSVILRMLQKQMERKRFISEGGAAATAGQTVGILAAEAPIFALSGPLAMAVGFPLVTSLGEGIQHLADPTRTVEESAFHIGISTGFGVGFGALHKMLSMGRLSPDKVNSFAKGIDDEIREMETGRPTNLTGNALLARFDELAVKTYKAEKFPGTDPLSAESEALLKGITTPEGSAAFSRSRGYTEGEIADFQEWIVVAQKVEKEHGINFTTSRSRDAHRAADEELAEELTASKLKAEATPTTAAEPRIVEEVAPGIEVEIRIGPITSDIKAPRPDGSTAMAFRRTEDGRDVIYFDREQVKATFADKPWRSPKVPGVKPLETDFATADDWAEFVMNHEKAHVIHKRKTGESIADYENRINQIALEADAATVPRSVGAAAREENPTNLADKPYERDFVPGGDENTLLPAFLMEKLPDGSPAKHLLQSSSNFARHAISYLVEHPWYQRKNVHTDPGATTAHGVDRNVAVTWIAPMIEAQKISDDLYRAYRLRFFNETKGAEASAKPHKSGVVQLADDLVRGRGGALSRTEFMEQITRAQIRTERAAGQTAADAGIIPEAIQAAKSWQEYLYSRAGAAAQELQVFSISQRRRLLVLEEKMSKLLADTKELGFTKKQLVFFESMEKQVKELEAEIKQADTFPLDPNYIPRIWNKVKITANRGVFAEILTKEAGMTPAEASATIDTILSGKAFQAIEEDATGVARSIKKRDVPVDSIYVEDFIELNAASIGRYYATRMGADMELTRAFGSVDLKEVIAKIAAEYDDLIKAASGKEKTAMREERAKSLEAFRAIRDRIRGTYGIPDNPSSYTNRGIRIAKMFNAVTLLTGALAATPDLGKLIMTDGLKRTIGPILDIYKSDLAMLHTMKMAKREANLAGEALDMYIAMRSALFADLADSLSAATPFERQIGNATQQSFNLNLMNQWNEGVKTLASLITGSRIIIEAENLLKGSISKTERIKLNNVGIGMEEARIIVAQQKKHGLTGEAGHVRIAKTELWDAEARAAAGIYTRALGKDINRIIVTPGKGESPLFMSTPIWTLIFQFKTFAIAATHRTLTPGLQLRDQNFMQGMIALTGLGAMVHEIRRYQLGNDREEKFGDWLISAIERGGHVGALSDVNQALETLSDNRIGLRPLLGAPRGFSTDMSKASTLGGPIVQQTANLARVIWDVGPGDADDRTADAIRRVMYGAKWFHTSAGFDLVEDGIAALIE